MAVCDRPPLAFRLRLEPGTLGDAVAEEGERARHRADLVPCRPAECRRRSDPRSSPPIALFSRRSGSTIERKTSKGQQDADQRRPPRRSPSRCGSPSVALASAASRAAHASPWRLCGELRQPLLDDVAVLAGLRQQRVADHPLVVGIGVDGLQRLRHIGVGLAPDVGRERRVVGGEPVEVAAEIGARLIGVALGDGEQADGEVGQPVANIAEGGRWRRWRPRAGRTARSPRRCASSSR